MVQAIRDHNRSFFKWQQKYEETAALSLFESRNKACISKLQEIFLLHPLKEYMNRPDSPCRNIIKNANLCPRNKITSHKLPSNVSEHHMEVLRSTIQLPATDSDAWLSLPTCTGVAASVDSRF